MSPPILKQRTSLPFLSARFALIRSRGRGRRRRHRPRIRRRQRRRRRRRAKRGRARWVLGREAGWREKGPARIFISKSNFCLASYVSSLPSSSSQPDRRGRGRPVAVAGRRSARPPAYALICLGGPPQRRATTAIAPPRKARATSLLSSFYPLTHSLRGALLGVVGFGISTPC